MANVPISNTIPDTIGQWARRNERLQPQSELSGYRLNELDTQDDFYESFEDGYGQVHSRAALVLVWVVAAILLGMILVSRLTFSADDLTFNSAAILQNDSQQPPSVLVEGAAAAAQPGSGQSAAERIIPDGSIATFFPPSVQYWSADIVRWAADAGLDPNMVATIMQIESCGDPQAESHAGAQGLFQVMPFHFGAGEVMKDPDTNARRGMNYLVERLKQTNGEVGRAFAGYNGGHGAAGSSWDRWAHETQRYYVWSTGIYSEAQQGLTESPTLNRWMQVGGSLCRQAEKRLGITP
jgi:hypothetical protein